MRLHDQDRTNSFGIRPGPESATTFAAFARNTSNHARLATPAHEAYYFCYDNNDADVICVFQLYASETAMQEFRRTRGMPIT